MKLLSDLEQQMISCLSSDVRLLNELSTTKKLAELKKQFDEAQERLGGNYIIDYPESQWSHKNK